MSEPMEFVGLPPPLKPSITRVKEYFQALDNFFKVFAIHPGDQVLMLIDSLLDPRVVDAISGLAKARGATVAAYVEPTTKLPRVPDAVQPLLKQATFVVSTWFCSILDPFCIGLRRDGQPGPRRPRGRVRQATRRQARQADDRA